MPKIIPLKNCPRLKNTNFVIRDCIRPQVGTAPHSPYINEENISTETVVYVTSCSYSLCWCLCHIYILYLTAAKLAPYPPAIYNDSENNFYLKG